MKKVLLFVISILSFSLLLVFNNAYAQEYPSEQYPSHLMKASYYPFVLYPIAEYDNTYEYELYYSVNALIYDINEIDCYLLNEEGIVFKKSFDISTNSYDINRLSQFPDFGSTAIYIRVTVLKSIVDEYHGSYDPVDPTPLFRYYSVLYVTYFSDTGSIDYDSGYITGYYEAKGFYYDLGYDIGYDFGYDDGYTVGSKASQPEVFEQGRQKGYDEASKKFRENFGLKVDVWLVPAIIIVFAIGIFVTYRRGRDV